MTTYETPPNSRPLKTMYAFISEDAIGNHGIVSARLAGQNFPLVTMEAHLLPYMKDAAQKAMMGTGKRIKLATLKVEKWEDI
jgi:hypothetical protein